MAEKIRPWNRPFRDRPRRDDEVITRKITAPNCKVTTCRNLHKAFKEKQIQPFPECPKRETHPKGCFHGPAVQYSHSNHNGAKQLHCSGGSSYSHVPRLKTWILTVFSELHWHSLRAEHALCWAATLLSTPLSINYKPFSWIAWQLWGSRG